MTETMTTEASAAPAAEADGWEWAIVEIFGHRRHAGRIREEERFGSKMLRIDVPKSEATGLDATWETHWYGGASIFSLTLTDEATVARANKRYDPPSRYLPPPADDGEDDDRPF